MTRRLTRVQTAGRLLMGAAIGAASFAFAWSMLTGLFG